MSNRFAYAALALLAAVAAAYQCYALFALHAFYSDFHAFWCAGAALAAHANPYHAAPLLACEGGNVAVPAPLPGYALALFVPLAHLPYALAAGVWFAISLVATATCVALTVRLSASSARLVMCVFALPAIVFWLPYGETVPVALAGLLFAGYAIRRERYTLAALGLVFGAISPVLALAPWIALFAFVRQMRVRVALAALALCALWALTGPALAMEYLRTVLPVHALAELPRAAQYSAAWIAYAAGTNPVAALRVGEASTLTALSIGVAAAFSFARRLQDRAAFVIVPLAAGVIGGTFVHAAEIAAAIPFALYLFARGSGAAKMLAAAALPVLAVPWYEFAYGPGMIIPSAAAAALAVFFIAARPVSALRAALVTVLFAAVLLSAGKHNATIRVAGPAPQILAANTQDASASWGRAVWNKEGTVTAGLLLAKFPLWFGLALVVGGAFAAVFSDKKLIALVGVDRVPLGPRA